MSRVRCFSSLWFYAVLNVVLGFALVTTWGNVWAEETPANATPATETTPTAGAKEDAKAPSAGTSPATAEVENTPAQETQAATAETIADRQKKISNDFQLLEETLLRMAELMSVTDPQRGAVLTRVIQQSREKRIHDELLVAEELLRDASYGKALDVQNRMLANLRDLLAILESENRNTKIRDEKERIKAYLKELNQQIREQQSLQGRTEATAEGNAERLAKLGKEQAELARKAGELSRKIKSESQDGQSPSADSPSSGTPSSEADGKDGKNAKGSENKDGKDADGKKDGDSKSSDGKDGAQAQDGSKSQEGSKPSDDPQGGSDAKSGEQPSDGQQNQDGQQGGQQGQQRQNGQQGGQQSQQGQQGPNDQQGGQQSQQGQQGPNDQQEDQQQAQQEQKPEDHLRQAQQRMEEAEKKLQEANQKGTLEDQQKALEELEQAKAELEKILRQLREEESKRYLALLEARLKKIQQMQQAIYDGTLRLDKVPEAERTYEHTVESTRLSRRELDAVLEAEKALMLLREEGSARMFPEVLAQMVQDMRTVAGMLGKGSVNKTVQTIEEDILATLEEMLEAVKKAEEELTDQQKQQMKQMEPGDMDDQALIDVLAEIKMIRSSQLRINRRTVILEQLRTEQKTPQDDIQKAMDDLVKQQEQIRKITREIGLP